MHRFRYDDYHVIAFFVDEKYLICGSVPLKLIDLPLYNYKCKICSTIITIDKYRFAEELMLWAAY